MDFTIPEIGGDILVVGDRKYRVFAHKPREAENLILQLKFETPLTKLVTLASEDPIIRSFCFLSHDRLYDEENETFALPILSLPLDDLKQKVEKKIDGIKKDAEEFRDNVKKIGDIIWNAIATSIAKTAMKYVRRAGKVIRKREKIRELILKQEEESLEKELRKELLVHREEIERFYEMLEMRKLTPAETLRTIGIYETLQDFIEKYDRLREMYEHLRTGGSTDINGFLERMQKMVKIGVLYGITVNSYCLNIECNFSSVQYNTTSIEERCPMCGENMIHFFTAYMDSDIKAAWEIGLIPEMIIAYMFSDEDWVQNIYLHKGIQQEKDGKTTKAIYPDVIIHTKNDKLVLIEVSTHYRENDIFRQINKKVENIKENGIDFDLLFYISSSLQLKQYISYLDKKCWILGAKHLKNLKSHIEYILKERTNI